MNIEAYIRASCRGDFQWKPTDTDDFTGQILVESCSYKGIDLNVRIFGIDGEYEIEIDDLENEPFYICGVRASRKSARLFVERIIRNDKDGNWEKNLKYVNY